MGPLHHLIRKEWILLGRDRHSLLLLFLMPTAFILIMSLALRGLFAGHGAVAVTYVLVDSDKSRASAQLAARIHAHPEFAAVDTPGDEEALRRLLRSGRTQFLVLVPPGFGASLDSGEPRPVRLYAAPTLDAAVVKLFDAALREAAARVYLRRSLDGLGPNPDGDSGAADRALERVDALVVSPPEEPGKSAGPTAVQQNVPAWLIFAMFFIAVPLSSTWVQERAQGTYQRLLSMGVPRWKLVLGKAIPYLCVSLAQGALMLAIGVWLVPLLGGDALELGAHPEALALMIAAVGFAAVSFALLVANIARSVEQATLLTGVCNLLFAALGGVMVPRFIMPPTLKAIGACSPMAWGLEGFLDVFLRRGGLADVAPRAGLLVGFGCAALSMAAFLFARDRRG